MTNSTDISNWSTKRVGGGQWTEEKAGYASPGIRQRSTCGSGYYTLRILTENMLHGLPTVFSCLSVVQYYGGTVVCTNEKGSTSTFNNLSLVVLILPSCMDSCGACFPCMDPHKQLQHASNARDFWLLKTTNDLRHTTNRLQPFPELSEGLSVHYLNLCTESSIQGGVLVGSDKTVE